MIGHGALEHNYDGVRMGDRTWCIKTYDGMGMGDRTWCIRTYDDVRMGDRACCIRTYDDVRMGDRAWCKNRSLFHFDAYYKHRVIGIR